MSGITTISTLTSTGTITADTFVGITSITSPLRVTAQGSTGRMAEINADGALELTRKTGGQGPYIDFKADGPTDYDARLQMDVSGGGSGSTDGELIFAVPFSGNLGSASVGERFRVQRGGAKVNGALEVTGDITALTSDIRLKLTLSLLTMLWIKYVRFLDSLTSIMKLRNLSVI